MSFSILSTFPPNPFPNLCPLFLISHCQSLLSLAQCNHLTSLVAVCLSPLGIHLFAALIFPDWVINCLVDSYGPQMKLKLLSIYSQTVAVISDLLFSCHYLPLFLLWSTSQPHSTTHVFLNAIRGWAHVVHPLHGAVALCFQSWHCCRWRPASHPPLPAFRIFHVCLPLLQILFCHELVHTSQGPLHCLCQEGRLPSYSTFI